MKENAVFETIYEAPELEVARLAAAPEGSQSHALSKLPVNITGRLDDLAIVLPRTQDGADHTMVVVPFERYRDTEERVFPLKRHHGAWRCIVVASDHPSYPVQGNRLCISESELVRGTLVTFDLSTAAATVDPAKAS